MSSDARSAARAIGGPLALLGRPSATLFLCLFATQASVVVLSPVLTEIASDFEVSAAAVGQLRTISGAVAGGGALAMGALAARYGLRDLILIGLALLAIGAAASAAAPSFAALAIAQAVVGGGLALVLSGALAAAAAWSTPERQARVLSWSLIGQPSAWIVGLPIIGLIADSSWRFAWLAVPLTASAVALVAVGRRARDTTTEPAHGTWALLRSERSVAGWGLGELFGFTAWTGVLVYAGALLVESYGSSPGTTGLILGLSAVAYLPGNFLARRWVDSSARRLLVLLPLAGSAVTLAFGAWRPAAGVSAAILATLAFLAGGRTIAGSARGLQVCSGRRVFAMRIRAAANQFGYLIGGAVGGIALAAGGYSALGAALAVVLLLAAVPHALAAFGRL